MGLDITAFAKAKFVTAEFEEEKHDTLEYHRIYAAKNFADRLNGKPEGVYTFDGKPICFGADSCGIYNAWRELLSLAVLGVLPEVTWKDFDAYKGKPFAELIYMSDCEGAIASETSKKLAADFETFKNTIEQKVRAVIASDGKYADYGDNSVRYWLSQYNNWHEAFKTARLHRSRLVTAPHGTVESHMTFHRTCA